MNEYKKLLNKSLQNVLNNTNLTYILKDLIWGIIRYKDGNWDDSLERFRGFIEHSHKLLYEKLINFTSNTFHLDYYEKTAKRFYNQLSSYIFLDLSINHITLLDDTRNIYKDSARHFHEIISNGSQSKFLLNIIKCIKLLLLVEEICFFLEKKKVNQLKLINIDEKYNVIFILKNQDLLEFFLDILFSQKIRDLLFKKTLLDNNDVRNSKFLQSYLPFYVFNHWRIENLLKGKIIYPFRPTGPHLIDFERGDWVYIPKIAKYAITLLKNMRKSILISGESGTGKTTISRYVGYSFFREDFTVFYIDCLDHSHKNIEEVLDQLNLYFKDDVKKVKNKSVLFIFENVHVIDEELQSKLNKCKDLFLCLITERAFKDSKKKLENKLKFDYPQIIKISLSHWTFKKTINGIIKKNCYSFSILNQLRIVGNQNLWIYAIILKLFQKDLGINKKSSLIELLINHELIGEELSDYFEGLLKSKITKIRISENVLFLNHLKYILAILSIFSEHELWTEKSFIDKICSINNETPLGKLNSVLNIQKDFLTEIQAFLINIFEIGQRNTYLRPGIKEKEFKIPHSQIAIIYKNCFLKIFEKSFPNLIKQISYLYISEGKYYGTVLEQLYLSNLRTKEIVDISEINKKFFDVNSYLKSIGYFINSEDINSSLNILKVQILNQSMEQNKLFFFYLSIYDSRLKNEIFEQLFQIDALLFNLNWKHKISISNPSTIFNFLVSVQEILGNDAFIDFFHKFRDEILKKFSEDNGNYIFRLLYLISKVHFNNWKNIYELVINLVETSDFKIENYQVFYFQNEEFFKKMNENHKFYPLVKQIFRNLIEKLTLQEELQFIPIQHRSNMNLFTQIYLELLKMVVNHESKGDFKHYNKFRDKLRKAELLKIIVYLSHLYSYNQKLSMNFFEKSLDIIKEKLYDSKVENIVDFFDILILDFKEEKQFLENSFLSNWEWFKGIFSRFSIEKFFYFSKFRIITNFFEELFPNYLKNYKDFFISQGKTRIKEYYDSLECKLDIYNKVNPFLGDELNEEILRLFNESIYNSLKDQNLSFFIDYFTKFASTFRDSILREKWDFKRFISSDIFKEILSNAEDKELKKVFNIFWDGDPWKSIFFDTYNDLFVERFSEKYKTFLKLSDEGLQYLEYLNKLVLNLDIVEILKIYNYYSDPIISDKNAYEFIYLRELIEENQDKFLGYEFKEKFYSLDFIDIFNFFVILKVYHPILLNNLYEKYNTIIFEKIEKASNEIIGVITILECYKLDLNFLIELDEHIRRGDLLFQMIMVRLNEIDLCTLRYLIQTNLADVLNIYTDIHISSHLKNSTLLQTAIFLYKNELNVAQKILGKKRIRKISVGGGFVQKFPKILELSEKQFSNLKINLISILKLDFKYRYSEIKFVSFLEHNHFLKNIIKNKFMFFPEIIVEKIKKSKLFDISFYFKSLSTYYNEINALKLEFPDNLDLYLTSEIFGNKIKKAEFNEVYEFLKYLKYINPNIAREIWQRNKSYLEDLKFTNKMKETEIYKIFKFYNLFADSHLQLNIKTLKSLKKILLTKNLRTTVNYLLDVSESDFIFLFSNFKNEIIEVGKNYSKFELANILRGSITRKYNKENLEVLRSIFKERLNEKYFFES